MRVPVSHLHSASRLASELFHIPVVVIGLLFGAGSTAASSDFEPVVIKPAWSSGDEVRYLVRREGTYDIMPGVPAEVATESDASVEVLETSRRGWTMAWTWGATRVTRGLLPFPEKHSFELQQGVRIEFFLKPAGYIERVINLDELRPRVRTIQQKVLDELEAAGRLPERGVVEARLARRLESDILLTADLTHEISRLFVCIGFEFNTPEPIWFEGYISNPPFTCSHASQTINAEIIERDPASDRVQMRWRIFESYRGIPEIDARLRTGETETVGSSVAVRQQSEIVFDLNAEATVDLQTGWPERVHYDHQTRGDVPETHVTLSFERPRETAAAPGS